jgi:hypothetical protein
MQQGLRFVGAAVLAQLTQTAAAVGEKSSPNQAQNTTHPVQHVEAEAVRNAAALAVEIVAKRQHDLEHLLEAVARKQRLARGRDKVGLLEYVLRRLAKR